MLDNVIDINYYAVRKARDSNMKHRPVGLGIMGFQELPAHAARSVRVAGSRRVRRPVDGGDRLFCLLALHRARRGARPLRFLRGVPLDRGIIAAGHVEPAARGTRRPRRDRHVRVDGVEALRERIKRHGMAIRTAWRSPRRQPSPTSSGPRRRSSRPSRTCSSSRTSRASSRW